MPGGELAAALLAVSVLAAPALAAGTGKTTQAPVIKAEQVKVKPSVLNANAKMGRHHVRHVRHHRFHKRMGALKSHQFSKVTIKHAGLPPSAVETDPRRAWLIHIAPPRPQRISGPARAIASRGRDQQKWEPVLRPIAPSSKKSA